MKFAYTILLLLFAVGGFSCKKPAHTLPISQETLIPILVDIHLAEAYAFSMPATKKDTILPLYYHQILQHYNTDQISLDSTLSILRKKPDLYIEIYQKVNESIDSIKI